ncbi:MAG: regulatory iron-sulfur-containing complex subunit RicT [Candidatus Gastranaerophilaceae bacterium]|uniref:Stage 0 sporulation protein n=1 Tax=Candidatus Limenecus avicola TaxID=2840847 RepID=A0A9D1MYA1_9CLOT|nr:stage 0 sporulation protein [Candidatus Limenecus avicola]
MIKYAVNLIKNTFHPLQIAESAHVEHGQLVLVRTEKGEEVAKVFVVNPLIAKAWESKMPESIPLIRVLGQKDLETLEELKIAEAEAFKTCKELVAQHNLHMNLVQTKYTFDRRKITFYYTAPERVDFRGLLKDLTQVFKRVRIDLRHIGVRDETSLLEGNGLCGRPFCCCTFLRKFDSINIKLAKDQGMPITPGKISGTCGRLLCCLNYEYKNYIDAAKDMPPIGSGVMTPDGLGRVCSLHFLSNEIAVKTEDGKIKNFKKEEIEMVDGDVNIEIDIQDTTVYQEQSDYNVDIKQLEDDRNSSTGNV